MESSYPYSVPPLPGRATLADMILWYATPDLRQELLDPDSTLTSELIDQALETLTTWRPTSDLHYGYFRHGRVTDWIVWSTVSAADPSMVAAFADPDENVEPWAIDIDTLPRYQGWPTALVKPEPPAELDPRVIVLPMEDLVGGPDDL